jgi:hypothetical protein
MIVSNGTPMLIARDTTNEGVNAPKNPNREAPASTLDAAIKPTPVTRMGTALPKTTSRRPARLRLNSMMLPMISAKVAAAKASPSTVTTARALPRPEKPLGTPQSDDIAEKN